MSYLTHSVRPTLQILNPLLYLYNSIDIMTAAPPTTGVMTAEQICVAMETVGQQLIDRFRNAEASVSADAVGKLYHEVRREDQTPKKKNQDVNLTKRLLNQRLKKIINHFFQSYVVPNLTRVEHSTHMDFLNVLLGNWAFIKLFAMVFKFILSKHQNHYMHAQEIKEDCASVPHLVLESVRINVLEKFKYKILSIITDTFEKERNQENTEKEKVKELFDIIENCGLEKLSDVIPSSVRTKTIEFKKYTLEKNEKVIHPNMDPVRYFTENYFPKISDDCVSSYKRRMNMLPAQPSEYIAEVIKIMRSERDRAEYYFFDDKFKDDYMTYIEKELVDKRIVDVLSQENGIQTFIETSSEKDLTGTYFLCKRRAEHTFPFLAKQVTDYFISAGKRISHGFLESEKKDANLYVDGMIALKLKFNDIVENFFRKDLEFTKLRNVVCKDILRYEGDEKLGIKKIEFMGARNLAQYANFKMRECAKLDAADKVEEILENISLIFQSLMSQDKFLSEHQIAMSKRLLEPYTNKPNSDVERILIRKLQHTVGPKDVSRHLGMLRDYDSSVEFEQKLNDKLEGTKVRVQPFVLQSDYWPDNQDVDIMFPNSLIVEKSKVEQIYSGYSQGKFLIWKVNRGISQMEGKFGQNTYRFTLNNLMMFIFFHIAEGPNRSILYGNLKQRFKLKRVKSEEEGGSLFDNEFKLNLLSLVQSKLVLRAKGLDPEIGEGESFEVNLGYVYTPPARQQKEKGPEKSKLKAVAVNINLQPSAKLKNELKVGSINTNQIIKKQRQFVMNGAIVQLMKHYKVMQFDHLVAEMRNHRQLQNIELKMAEVKERIENLITNDYLDREENDRNKLIYKP